MSGGHYDYTWSKIETLADEIRNDLDQAMKPEEFERGSSGFEYSMNGYLIEAIGPESEARQIVEKIMKDLYRISKEAKEVEWLLSGDTGVSTFLERYNKIQKEYVSTN
jgi:hypothetical protein